MKKKITLIIIAFLICLQALLLLQVFSSQNIEPLDSVLINDIQQSALQQWQALSETHSFINPDQDHIFDLTIINNQEDVLYTTQRDLFIQFTAFSF